jgi:competence protein ComEC
MSFRTAIKGAACALALTALGAGAAIAAEAPLRIIAVDVEGGAATLFVTPEGQSLLIDTGWPAGAGGPPVAPGETPAPTLSSAQRIVAAMKNAGLSSLDYLLISHYHLDHAGGFPELAALVPIGAFVDHGPNSQPLSPTATPAQVATAAATLYARYEAVVAGKRRISMKPGDVLRLGDLTFTAINSDRQFIAEPVAGAGGPGAGCGDIIAKPTQGEDPHSLGLLAQWGSARILALADSPWSVETELVCPINRIGKIDLMIADNHGNDAANSPQLLASVRPTTVLVSNGPTKGADGPALDRIAAVTGLDATWQVHFATRSPEKNAPEAQIANLGAGAADAAHPLIISVTKAGDVTFANPRTGGSRTYPKAR